MVPIKIGCESARVKAYTGTEDNAAQRSLELDLITETRNQTNMWFHAYRQRMSQVYNKRVIPRSFHIGDFMWKKRRPIGGVGKLEPRWEGSYRITSWLTGESYYLADPQETELSRPWHATHLRSYRT